MHSAFERPAWNDNDFLIFSFVDWRSSTMIPRYYNSAATLLRMGSDFPTACRNRHRRSDDLYYRFAHFILQTRRWITNFSLRLYTASITWPAVFQLPIITFNERLRRARNEFSEPSSSACRLKILIQWPMWQLTEGGFNLRGLLRVALGSIQPYTSAGS